MKKEIIILLLSLLTVVSFSQTPDTLWLKTFGGSGYEEGQLVQQTFEGGYIIVGNTNSFGAGNYDIWLIKTDSNGDTLWTKTFGGNDNDEGYSVQQTVDEGYIISGATKSFGAGNYDVWLIKTDSNGDTLWTKTFGGNYNDRGLSVQQTTDHGYIITGYKGEIPSVGGEYGWLIKTNSTGDTLWTKTFYGTGRSVQQTSDMGYILAGHILQNYVDVMWMKTNDSGDILWIKTWGGSYDDAGSSVQQTADGGYIITGHREIIPAVGQGDVFLIKTDDSGNILWTKIFGGNETDVGYSVQQTIDQGYIITGYTSSYGAGSTDVWLIKTDSNGNTLWTRTFGGSSWEMGHSVQQTMDGGYIITGSTHSFGAGSGDVLLIKTTSNIGDTEPQEDLIIEDYYLYQNFPNPFNPSTVINYQLPIGSEVTLKIYDILGNEIATLVNDYKSAGRYEVEFSVAQDSRPDIASGIYFYQLRAGSFIETKKMVLMK